MPTIIDEPQRLQALDTTQSFIVQAPAGSGKTELLTQRYLALLAQAKVPEEIIAITFTRKAANEMRLRILQALQDADQQPIPDDTNKQRRWHLAKAVLQRNQQQQWNLLENPNRLRVQTIDSLCASITRQMPMLSRFGAQPTIADNANQLYQQAAEAVLAQLEQNNTWTPALCTLLSHLNNNHERVAELFCDMLKKRDQWLGHIFQTKNNREMLEQGLQRAIREAITLLHHSLPATLWDEISELLIFASRDEQIPLSTPLLKAQAIADLLLTDKNTWRKTVDKRSGFPPEEKAMKQRMQDLLAEMTAYEAARECLIDVRQLPSVNYTDKQWQLLDALFTLLPILAAQLHLIFQANGAVDHIQIAQSALVALGDTQNPTDLALALDYRIQHLLVDEFQDTSITQLHLLEQLTAGWQANDGHTLFLVGDPMQSIYRFRKAEVGIFLQVRDYGIGNIHPKFLNLKVNFRSVANIVNWTNQIFEQLLPQQENISRGAITFSRSIANHADDKNNTVQAHWLIDGNHSDEAQQVATIVEQSLKNNTEHNIAILVRARSHLRDISRALKQKNIPYRAVEIEKLDARPVIQDLLALTRALLHPADRIAWLAMLRAPWCGLSLQDLHTLTQAEMGTTIWECLQRYSELNLSVDAQQRLNRIIPVLAKTLQQRARQPLKQWLTGTWLALGGPACLVTQDELNDSKTFFNLLSTLTKAGDALDLSQLETQLQNLYAENQQATDIRVDVMTMHKAKGLEFDVVVLPGLGRASAQDDPQLLLLMERATVDGSTDLLLAPIKASDTKLDSIYKYLAYEEKKKTEYEMMRLLYVAATRAKQSLHLIGIIKNSAKNEQAKPVANSLLAHLWPILGGDVNANIINFQNVCEKNEWTQHAAHLRRLVVDWQLYNLSETRVTQATNNKPLPWNIDSARAIGSVVHLLLCKISRDGVEKIEQQVIKNLLLQNNTTPNQLTESIANVERALAQTLQSRRGRWILNRDHQDAHSEYPLTTIIDGKVKQMIIDRTFIDADNIRWIIDYKTTENNIEVDCYREQLETYAQAMRLLSNNSIKLGVYFPLSSTWHEWEFK